MRRHIAAQTTQHVALLSAPDVERADDDPLVLDQVLATDPDAVVIDLLSEAAEARVGLVLSHMAGRWNPLFVVGSSGVEYALVALWKALGRLPTAPPRMIAGPVDQLLVISGSCSPATGAQIEAAVRGGFSEIALDPLALLKEGSDGSYAERVVGEMVALLEAGHSVVTHSSKGPIDPREASVNDHFADTGLSSQEGRIQGGRALAKAAGILLDRVLRRVPLNRFLIAGGDTSTAAVKALGIDALEMFAPLAPGAPICRALAPGREMHHRELILKGGQIGSPDFFLQAKAGRA